MRRFDGDRACLVLGWALLSLAVVAWAAGPLRPGASGLMAPLLGVWLAAALLVGASWWTARASGPSRLVASFALAASAPLAAVSIVSLAAPMPMAIGWTAASLAILPLCWTLSEAVTEDVRRRALRGLSMAVVMVVVAIWWLGPLSSEGRDSTSGNSQALGWILLTLAVGVPAIVSAGAVLRAGQISRREAVSASSGTVGVAVAVSAAVLALVVPWWPLLVGPVLAVAATAVILGRIAIGPLEAEANVAVSQRDLIVAAADAERYRLASALHDGPLGDLALLVQRLDSRGDSDNAALARAVAGDLRSIGNDLRVPILDDLGAAPAIEWLVERLAERSHMAIDTELLAPVRPPGDVELAVYRIAQEALANAIRHGNGPVHVRYVSQPRTVSLSVIDAGPGLAQDAPARALREGRLGLLLMRQRAEAIGGHLVLRSLGTGGTEVGLTWAPVAP